MVYYHTTYTDAMLVPVSRRHRWVLLYEEEQQKAHNVAESKARVRGGRRR